MAISFVSHKLEEVFDICDTVTVLRDGRNACDSQPLKGMNRSDVVKMMIGREERIAKRSPRPRTQAEPLLELKNYGSAAGHAGITLAVRPGEILGLYGLVGAGRSELAKGILGMVRKTAGEVRMAGKLTDIRSAAEALHIHGIGYVSEDRKQEGLILLHSVSWQCRHYFMAQARVGLWLSA